MNRLLFAAVADDDTGASDLAGMLAGQGLRTLLIIDLPTTEQFAEWSNGYHAVVMAEGTRNLPPEAARERTLAALRILKARDPRIFQIKYCSTFDSTPEGNIGTTLDAALDELKETFTIAVPALPVNGRTTYQGYHFVNGQVLSDSPMRDHPLTPMTNSNLVELLRRQTKRRVGLAPYNEVEGGVERLKKCFADLREQGVGIAIVDCLNDEHLEIICRAAADLRLISGSSAFGIKMPEVWRERGWVAELTKCSDDLFVDASSAVASNRGCLIIAGSCSVATRGQNEWLAAQGTHAIHITPQNLLTPDFKRTAFIEQARNELNANRHCLLTTTNSLTEVRRAQEWGENQGLTISAFGESLAYALADVAAEILQNETACGLIVAGGETSGAVCRRMKFGALRVGRNIEHGVPLCFSLGNHQLPVVLKSGNFGSVDFYGKALQAIAQFAAYMI